MRSAMNSSAWCQIEPRMVPGRRVTETIMRIHSLGIHDIMVSGRAMTRTAPAPLMLDRLQGNRDS